MPEKKNQHIVPQYYLRGFSKDRDDASIKNADKRICRYNLKEPVKPHTVIKKVCKGSYYYGKSEYLEQALSELENMQAHALNKLITDKRTDWLTSEDGLFLLMFIMLLKTRTESARQLAVKMTETIYKDIGQMYFEKNNLQDYSVRVTVNPEWAHYSTMSNLWDKSFVISDLYPILLINESKKHFITSDDPVIFYNYKNVKDINTTCGYCSGLMIFCPLTETLLFLLIDKDLYDIRKDTQTTVRVKKDSDIDSINKLQLLNCNEEIYCCDDSELEYIKELHSSVKNHITERKVISKLGGFTHPNVQKGEIYSLTTTDIYFKITLSFIKLNKENNRKYNLIMRESAKTDNPFPVTRKALLAFRK